jgi:hypothetical protein
MLQFNKLGNSEGSERRVEVARHYKFYYGVVVNYHGHKARGFKPESLSR